MCRVGFGYDVHRFIKGRRLILGGVTIPYSMGLQGHSDADVLTHAIMDSILGALAKGDIGQHFPDTDPLYKDVDSLVLLEKILELMKDSGYRIHNLDSTIVAEEPRIGPHIPGMREKLSGILGMDTNHLSIKATTNEGMGFCGRKEGIAAYSIVSLVPIHPE